MTLSSTAIHEPIKIDEAERLSRSLARKVEGDLYRMFNEQVREHIHAQFNGILKGIYMRPDGDLGHIGIERTIKNKEADQMWSKKGSKKS